MSALLHPVGPEPEETYWVRRFLTLLVLVVVVSVLVWVVRTAFGGNSESATIGATPSASSTLGPSDLGSPTYSLPGEGASSPASTAGSTSTAAPSTSALGSTAPSLPASSSPVPSSPAPSSPAPGSTAPAATTPTPTPTPTGPVPCTEDDLRVIPTGARQVVSGRTTTFRVHLVNTSTRTCTIDFASSPLRFWINSGNDRIHTIEHCPKLAPTGTITLKPTQRHVWAHTWATKRSVAGCGTRPDYLRPGTYVANATLGDGPVNQWVLRLVG